MLKNIDFRGSPSPTVLMVYEHDIRPNLPRDQIIPFGGLFYSIIGHDIIGPQDFAEDDIIDMGVRYFSKKNHKR